MARAECPSTWSSELKHLEECGYGSVYFVDDHFLLQPKRIEAICQGVMDAKLTIQWGIEGRVDSVAQHLFPAMAKAHCRTVMFGIESGSQKILDRLKKEQTLEEVEPQRSRTPSRPASRSCTASSPWATPMKPVEDMNATFDLASKLPLDTFGFNRLCVYRGTPLWQEYVKRGLVSDTTDWYKYFKCSEIDPTCLPGEVINEVRASGAQATVHLQVPTLSLQTFRLLRRFLRFMPARDVVYLIIKPFLGQKKGATKAEVLSRAVEHGEMKDAAAQLTQMTDEMLHQRDGRVTAGTVTHSAGSRKFARTADGPLSVT